jgi:hypothetical protein
MEAAAEASGFPILVSEGRLRNADASAELPGTP